MFHRFNHECSAVSYTSCRYGILLHTASHDPPGSTTLQQRQEHALSFIAEKRQLTTDPAPAETQCGEVEREAGERGARRAGYAFVAVGLLLMVLSSGVSLADARRGLETGLREDLGLDHLLDASGYDFAGTEVEQDLLSPDYEEVSPGGGTPDPEESR
jgi:hypothetical protein